MKTLKRNFFILFLLPFVLNAQNNQWAWMKGSNTPNSTGSYGIMGVANPANNPPARYEAAEWTDNQGRFWIYGGFEFVTNNTYADLWMYNPATNAWTWMNGTQSVNIAPVYGTQGVPSPANTPGSRKYAMCTWTDQQGNLWLLGGYTINGIGNDLWKYDMTLNQWVWMHGANTAFPSGNYGTQGVPAPTNDPSYRCETSATWVSNSGDLWFFGGQGNGNFNDLWRYNIATNMWTWMNGSQFGFAAGNWGTQGVAAPSNVPSGRVVYASWKDLAGNFWLFGGNDSSFFSGGGSRNDMWKYDLATNMWTWMSGTNIVNHPGVYGPLCTPSVSYCPASRMECRTRWVDDCGNLWLFGGGINGGGTGGFNDLWKFNTMSNEWTWVSGSNTWNQSGVYGVQTVANAANHPGWRMGSVGWKNSQGLWLFGGAASNTNFYNDVWKYIPDKPTAAFTGTPTSGCAPLTVQFSDQSAPNCTDISTWLWNFGDPSSGPNNTSALQNPSHTFNAQGTYTVKLVVTSCLGMKDSTMLTINANTGLNLSATTVPASCGNPTGSATVNVANGTGPFSYTWSSGGTNATENNLAAGSYTCTVTDANGCQGSQTVSISNNTTLSLSSTQTNVSCNGGNNGSATVTPAGGNSPYTYSWTSGGTNATENNLPAGSYTCTVTDAAGCSSTQTISITQPAALSFATASTAATCGNNNGTASVNVTGGAGSYTYSWFPSGGSSANATALAGGNYTVTVADANGCTGTASVNVASTSAMTASLSTQQDVTCNGGNNGSATVSASGGTGTYTYVWSPGGGTNATENNLTANVYTVTITDAAGCVSTVSVNITEPAAISLTTSGNDTICTGNTTTLLASATGGVGSFSYVWNPGSIVANSLTVSPATSTTYLVTATDANGCSSSQSVTVTVNQPVALITAGTTQICAGQSTTISANATNGGPYTWQPGNTTGGSISVSPTITTTYTVSVWDACLNAFVTDSVTVSVESATSLFQQSPSQGCGPLTVQFTDQSFASSGNITGWSWDFGDGNTSSLQNPTHTYTTPGTYTVTLTVTSAAGCTQTFVGPTPVDVYPSPTAAFSVLNLPVTTLDPTAQFLNGSLGGVAWSWYFGDGDTSTIQNPSHTYANDTGTYTITLIASNQYGCMDTAISTLTIYEEFAFYIPNAFSPNGDGLNDNFGGIGVGIEEYHLLVFDRWGMLIYDSHDYGKPWDGTFKGNKVQQDVYVYKIDITDIFNAPHHYIGHVSVVR